MRKTNHNETRRSTALWIVPLISLLVWAEKADASLSDILLGSPIQSIPCSGCTQSESFSPQTTLQQPFAVTSAVWSPDGKYLSVGSGFEGHIVVYDTSSCKTVGSLNREWAGDENSVIQFLLDSQSLAMPRINYDYGLNVATETWNFETNQVSGVYYSIFQSEAALGPYIQAGDSRAKALAVSKDFIASSVGGNDNGYVIIFSIARHDIVQKIECSRYNVPNAMTFSPDESALIVAGCHLYDVEGYLVQSGHMTFQTQVDPGNWDYNFISYNEDGSLIAVGSSGSEHSTLTMLNAENGAISESFPRERADITNLQWINDHLILASYDGVHPDGSVARVWDTNSRSLYQPG